MPLASYLSSFLSRPFASPESKPDDDAAVPSTMRQWTTALNGLDELREDDDVVVPAPRDGEVLVRIHAVGLNLRDVEVCTGRYNSTQHPGRIVPCSDMCGTVVRSRSPVLPPGTRVASIVLQSHLQGPLRQDHLASGLGVPLPGVLAEYRVFPASGLVRVPGYLTDEQAACLPSSAVTAWSALTWMRPSNQPLGTDDTPPYVFLQGTNDVSLAGLQIAHAAGHKTIIAAPSDAHLGRATRLGADHGFNSNTHWDWHKPVMDATAGRGADVILESVPHARALRKSFQSVAFGGAISCVGYLSGITGGFEPGRGAGRNGPRSPELHADDVNELALRRCATLGAVVGGGRDRFEDMLRFYCHRQIRPLVDTVFAFRQARDALRYLEDGTAFGKVVVRVGPP
ncbi:hypothetical protein E4U42_002954 [Claviceps africana]|uniref:Enoyl reductase (ER) domain-containing protein n=1 Tax=Claviceps africana TaxID=83212 RepID=A0A8K0JA11_9HYPO|nr:hypothetical protein E4U42_002954 [Claviceps africana]